MKTLLILDDAVEYLNSLRNALKSDFNIITAISLKEAQGKANDVCDIFLVDVRLNEDDASNLDGIVFLQWIKQKYPTKPVILMSAYVADNGASLVEKGASAFMEKPVFLAELRSQLAQLLSQI